MATVRATTVVDQNTATLAGVQVDTAVYVGTGTAAAPSGVIPYKVGVNAPVYVIAGIQTAAVVDVVLDTNNAYAGASADFRFGTAMTGTSTIRLRNATTAGTILAITTAGQSPGSEHNLLATFDGTAWQ